MDIFFKLIFIILAFKSEIKLYDENIIKSLGKNTIDGQLFNHSKNLYNRELVLDILTTFDDQNNPNPELLCSNGFSDFGWTTYINFALVVNLGDCSPVSLALKAESLDTNLLILVNNKSLEIDSNTFDNRKGLINIPVMIISKEEGSKLLNSIEKLDVNKPKLITFSEKVNLSNTINLDIGFNNSNQHFFMFLKDLMNYLQYFKKKVDLNLYYLNEQCDDDKCTKLELEKKCLNNDPNACSLNTNIEDIKLQIGILCFYENDLLANLLEYDNFKCKNYFNLDCFLESTFKLPNYQKQKYKKCIENNFKSGDIIKKNNENIKKKFTNNFFSPTVLINNEVYYKELTTVRMFEEICVSFNKIPDNCLYINEKFVNSNIIDDIKNNKYNKQKMIVVKIVILLISILFVVSILFFFCFKSSYRRILKSQLHEMIKDSVGKFNNLN